MYLIKVLKFLYVNIKCPRVFKILEAHFKLKAVQNIKIF